MSDQENSHFRDPLTEMEQQLAHPQQPRLNSPQSPDGALAQQLAERISLLRTATQEERVKGLMAIVTKALGPDFLNLPAQINECMETIRLQSQTMQEESQARKRHTQIMDQAAKDLSSLRARPVPAPPSKLPWIITAVLIVFLAVGAIVWHSSIRSALAAIPMVTIESAEKRAAAREELAKLGAQIEQKQKDLSSMEAELSRKRSETMDVTQSLNTTLQARTQAQLELGSMETLKQRHRGSLIPGSNGHLYAEVTENPTPFLYNGKWYVEVKEASATTPTMK